MFTMAHLNRLQDLAEAPYVEFGEAQRTSGRAHDYREAFVDHVPCNLDEALESFALAADLGVPVERIADLTRRAGRTLEALIELRRLVSRADELEDACVPPLKWEARVLRSLIGWMTKPVVTI